MTFQYLDKKGGHSLRCIVVSRDTVNHSDSIDESRDPIQHTNLTTQENVTIKFNIFTILKYSSQLNSFNM